MKSIKTKSILETFFELSPIGKLTIINCLFEQKEFFDDEAFNYVKYSSNRQKRKEQQIKEFWKLIPKTRSKKRTDTDGYHEPDTFFKFSHDWQFEMDAHKTRESKQKEQ